MEKCYLTGNTAFSVHSRSVDARATLSLMSENVISNFKNGLPPSFIETCQYNQVIFCMFCIEISNVHTRAFMLCWFPLYFCNAQLVCEQNIYISTEVGWFLSVRRPPKVLIITAVSTKQSLSGCCCFQVSLSAVFPNSWCPHVALGLQLVGFPAA